MAAVALVLKAALLLAGAAFSAAAATWCVVRSDASEEVMQRALDYACSGGADCAPILPSGLCYLPNTLQAHTSYAINSFYQRHGDAPDACSFGGAAATATTDPSYGSCVYPSSPRNAGGSVATPTSTTTPTTIPTLKEPPPPPTTTSTAPLYGDGGSLNPGMGSIVANAPASNASSNLFKRSICITYSIFLLVFSCIFQTI